MTRKSKIEPLLNKTLLCLDEALADAKLLATQIDRVILVGGASRTPMIHRLLHEQLPCPVHAEVDPDLCVSMGAAIQGGLISGQTVGPVLVDITSHTLGISCLGELHGVPSVFFFARIIERNSALPASRSEMFGTTVDNQQVAAIEVYQGEDDDARENEFIGEFSLEGLAEVDRGNQILVRFDLDLDGILKVTAIEHATGLEKRLTIDNAVSRFRRAAQAGPLPQTSAALHTRIDGGQAALTGPPPAHVYSADAQLDLPPDLRELARRAEQLLAKSVHITAQVSAEDAEEIRELQTRIRTAIADQSKEPLEAALAKLEDLVFYLQDVP